MIFPLVDTSSNKSDSFIEFIDCYEYNIFFYIFFCDVCIWIYSFMKLLIAIVKGQFSVIIEIIHQYLDVIYVCFFCFSYEHSLERKSLKLTMI